MSTSLDTMYAWRERVLPRPSRRSHTATLSSPLPLRSLQLISDRSSIRALPLDTPLFASLEEAFAFLRDSNPSPDINLTYIHGLDPSEHACVSIMDTPLYCGPDSPDTLLALSFRYPSIWVPTSLTNQHTLPFPLHVTTRRCLYNEYTLVINSPSVIQRVRTRHSNIASRIEALCSGGPLLPLSLFNSPSLLSYYPTLNYHTRHIHITHRKGDAVNDPRSSVLQSLLSHLLSIPDPSHHFSPNPNWRHLRDSLRTRDLLLALLPFLPHLPTLIDPSPLSSTPYTDLHSYLEVLSVPYWDFTYLPSAHFLHGSPLFNEGLTSKGFVRVQRPSTTNGSLLAALIAREIRIGLRLQNLTLSRAKALLPS